MATRKLSLTGLVGEGDGDNVAHFPESIERDDSKEDDAPDSSDTLEPVGRIQSAMKSNAEGSRFSASDSPSRVRSKPHFLEEGNDSIPLGMSATTPHPQYGSVDRSTLETPISQREKFSARPSTVSVGFLRLHAGMPTEQEQWTMKLMELKASVYETYTVCAGLMTSVCVCSVWIQTPALDVSSTRFWLLTIHQFFQRCTVGVGLYCTIIFAFCAMYHKTSLANPTYGIVLFRRIEKGTGWYRMVAFYAMFYNILLIILNLSFSMFYSMRTPVAIFGGICVMFILVMTYRHGCAIMEIASAEFLPHNQLTQKLKEEGLLVNSPRSNRRGSAASDASDATSVTEATSVLPPHAP